MQTTNSIEIDRPIDEVFRLANDHMAEWSQVVISDEVIEEKPEGVGTVFRTITEENGRQMEFQGVVTRYDPPHVSAVHLISQQLVIDTKFTFTDLGDRTRVTQQAHVTGRGIFKLLLPLFGLFMHKANCEAQENELANLKQFCENSTE